jgi:hypothetical protein
MEKITSKKFLFLSFLYVCCLLLALILMNSCTQTKRGFDYKGHARKGQVITKNALKVNKGKSLVNYKCTNKH